MTTTIQKWGNSQGIRLPKFILDAVHWNGNEEVEVLVENGELVIKKAENHKRKNIRELFENFDGEYQPVDMDWGTPTGEEIW